MLYNAIYALNLERANYIRVLTATDLQQLEAEEAEIEFGGMRGNLGTSKTAKDKVPGKKTRDRTRHQRESNSMVTERRGDDIESPTSNRGKRGQQATHDPKSPDGQENHSKEEISEPISSGEKNTSSRETAEKGPETSPETSDIGEEFWGGAPTLRAAVFLLPLCLRIA